MKRRDSDVDIIDFHRSFGYLRSLHIRFAVIRVVKLGSRQKGTPMSLGWTICECSKIQYPDLTGCTY